MCCCKCRCNEPVEISLTQEVGLGFGVKRARKRSEPAIPNISAGKPSGEPPWQDPWAERTLRHSAEPPPDRTGIQFDAPTPWRCILGFHAWDEGFDPGERYSAVCTNTRRHTCRLCGKVKDRHS